MTIVKKDVNTLLVIELKEKGLSMRVSGFPLDLHFIDDSGHQLVFDVRSFSVFRVRDDIASVLKLMREMSIEDICIELRDAMPVSKIVSTYKYFERMISTGLISSKKLKPKEDPKFSNLVIMMAGGCNMGCSYCFEKDVPIYQNPNLLTQENSDRILTWYFKHMNSSTGHIEFYGGEPLINWPMVKYTIEKAKEMAAQRDISLGMYMITNATRLTTDIAEFLAANQVTVQVSIDGDKDSHDRYRVLKSGRSTYDKVVRGVKNLISADADFNVRATLTKENVEVKNVIDSLKDIGATNISFDVVTSDEEEIKFNSDDWSKFHTSLEDYISSSGDELTPEITRIISYLQNGSQLTFGCGAGKVEVTVAPNGDIYECQRLYKTPYSNISLDIGPDELGSNFLTNVDAKEGCKSCWARYLCGGGCKQQAEVETGTEYPFGPFCKTKKINAEAAIRAHYKQVLAENSPESEVIGELCEA